MSVDRQAAHNGQPPRRARKRDSDVLAAAIAVFARRGYEAASIQDVADELGMMKGSLYHYIETKEDLLFRLCESLHIDMDVILDTLEQADDMSPIQKLSTYIRRHIEYNLAHLKPVSVYYHDMGSLTGSRRTQVEASQRRHRRFVEGLIEEAKEAGEVRADLDASVVSSCIFAISISTYRWYRPKGRLSRTQLAREITEFALHGMLTPTGTCALEGSPAKPAQA